MKTLVGLILFKRSLHNLPFLLRSGTLKILALLTVLTSVARQPRRLRLPDSLTFAATPYPN
jgi:hypothetical protein